MTTKVNKIYEKYLLAEDKDTYISSLDETDSV